MKRTFHRNRKKLHRKLGFLSMTSSIKNRKIKKGRWLLRRS